jgi:hypothetical protein
MVFHRLLCGAAENDHGNTRHVDALDRDSNETGFLEKRFEIEVPVHTRHENGQTTDETIHKAVVSTVVEMIEQDDASLRPTDAPHLARDLDRIRYDVQHIRRIYGVELPVAKGEAGGVHAAQSDVTRAAFRNPGARARQHRCGQIDPRNVAPVRVMRPAQASANADLEDRLSRCRREVMHRPPSSMLQRRAIDDVIDRRQARVDGLDGGWSTKTAAPTPTGRLDRE